MNVTLQSDPMSSDLTPAKAYPTRTVMTSGGTSVNVPLNNDERCGDAQLPCTPDPEGLRLRKAGQIGSGWLPRLN